MAAIAQGAAGPLVSLAPVGCDQCASTTLRPVGGGKFQCDHCGAFMLEREPPPLPEAPPVADPMRPPPSPVNRVSAVEVLALDANGLVAAPSPEDLALVLDRNGPRAFYRPAPLSRFVTIERATGHAPIRLEYQVFLETRRYEEVLDPYRGQAPVTTPLPPIWAAPLQPAREVTTRRVPVPGQQSVTTCPRCNGSGSIVCFTCGGQGRVDCPFCQSGVNVTQVVTNGKWSSRSEPCAHCHGRGSQTCSTCGGDGRLTCDVCQGCARVLRRWERIEDFTLPTATHAVSDGRDWSHHAWMSRAEGQLLFDRAVQGRLDLTETDGPIARLADEVILAHNHYVAEGYAYWSRFVVTRVPVVEVAYRVRKTPGTLHVYGGDQRVSMPGKKPVGCLGCLFWTLSAVGAAAGLTAVALSSVF
jgi:hypothetical protein